MRTIKNTIELETWEDPGDYPNAIAAAPLPSMVVGNGKIVVELNNSEAYSGSWEDSFSDYLNEEIDSHYGYSVSWDWSQDGNIVTAWVESVEPWDRDDYRD
jgi:hypothetical protein